MTMPSFVTFLGRWFGRQDRVFRILGRAGAGARSRRVRPQVECLEPRLAPAGYNLTTLATFDKTNGAYPAAGLTVGYGGRLFGTTEYGGAHGHGTVFELVPRGTGPGDRVKTLHSFGSA